MEKKNLKKWVIEKETISNLSKFQQGIVWGGYDCGSFNGTCGSQCDTWCPTRCGECTHFMCSGTCHEECCGTTCCK